MEKQGYEVAPIQTRPLADEQIIRFVESPDLRGNMHLLTPLQNAAKKCGT
jgi:hypothetical protein